MSKPMRWSKFWWQDYDRDQALRGCSLAAQGLWMRLLCFMHEGEPYGHLVVNGKPPTSKFIAAMVGKAEREIVGALAELEEFGVFSRTPDGVIYSRRLVRDKAASDTGRAHGVNGGNPALTAKSVETVKPTPGEGGLTPPVISQEAEAKKEKREPPVRPPVAADAPPMATQTRRADRGVRLPSDWQPSPADVAFAVQQGLDPQAAAAEFRDYWCAVPGAKGCKLDWPATFRNRCRERAARRQVFSTPRETLSERRRRELGIKSILDWDEPASEPLTLEGRFHA